MKWACWKLRRLHVCVIDLTKAYDYVDRTLLWTALTRFGVPQNLISVIHQPRWHASMRAARRQGVLRVVRYGTGLRQGCVLSRLLFNIFVAAVINVTYTRFKADKDIIDALVHLRKKKGAGGRGKALPESQSCRRRFGACFTLTMPGSSRNHPSSCGRW